MLAPQGLRMRVDHAAPELLEDAGLREEVPQPDGHLGRPVQQVHEPVPIRLLQLKVGAVGKDTSGLGNRRKRTG
jgi:hypothetical protein